jgi:hypothetical protein
VAARCAELQAAQNHVRMTAGHHDSVDAALRTALAAPNAHMHDGRAATAVRSLRRERHHARDQLSVAQMHAAEAQRRYDEAVCAVPATCGPCPPCVSATAAVRPLATTPA